MSSKGGKYQFCIKQGYKFLKKVKKRPSGLSGPSEPAGFRRKTHIQGYKFLKTARKRPTAATIRKLHKIRTAAHKLDSCGRLVIAGS